MTESDGNFVYLAKRAFFFLNAFGLQLKNCKESRLLYEGNGISVEVCYWRSHYELGVKISREASGESYGLAEILEVVAPETARNAGYQCRNTTGLEKGLQVLADLLRKHCASLLRNDPESFDRIRGPIQVSRQKYTDRYRFGAIRNRAQKAWEDKDWEQSEELYSSMEDDLTEIEGRRLVYLRKKRNS